MKELIKKELNGPEPKILGDDGKNKRIAKLSDLKRMKIAERNVLTKEINLLSKQIEEFQKDISPNQYTMF